MTHKQSHITTGTAVELLAKEPRRQVLQRLDNVEGETTLGWLARSMTPTESSEEMAADALERRLVELHHHHLPALADADVLAYNTKTGVVRRGPAFESAVSVLDAISWDC